MSRLRTPALKLLISLLTASLAACGVRGGPRSAEAPLPAATALPDDTFTEQQAAATDAPPPDASIIVPSGFQLNFDMTASQEQRILNQYSHLDREKQINPLILKKAVLFYHLNRLRIQNKIYMTVVDFSLRSTLNRMFVINLMTGRVWAMHVAQGKGSDANADGLLDRFSNENNSNATSRGFYLTAETYEGVHGYSLRLDGLSPTNSLARSRAIVLHAADYVIEADVIQGRSWGCLAVAASNATALINLIKGGSLIFVDG